MKQGLKLIFMGVCGSGKTTLAERTASYLGCGPVLEADTFHTPEMREKMRSGTPLSDDDRWPWLERIRQAMLLSGEQTVIVTCSALRRVYRDLLVGGELEGRVVFLFLDVSRETISERLAVRQHEYMPASLLGSQFNTLERPTDDEPVVFITAEGSEDQVFARITEELDRLR